MKPRKLFPAILLTASLVFALVFWTDVTLGKGEEVIPDESVFAMLPESLVSLQLHEADLKSILRALGKEYKLNLLVHEKIEGQITLGLENIALRDALQAIARNRGLKLVPGPGGTIEILPIQTYQARLKSVAAATREAAPVESPPPSPLITQKIDVQYAFNPRESISAVGRDIGLSGKQVKDLTELSDLLKKRLSGQPGSDITALSRLNALVVTDTPEKIEEIMGIVSLLDVPSITVGIEARIAEVTNQALEDLGVQWGGLGQFGDATFTGGGLGAQTGEQPNIPQSGNTGLSGSNFIVNLPATIPIGGPGSSLGFTLGRSATKVLDIQISALQQDGKLKLLAAPRLTTMDHERAWIESGTEIPYRNQSVSGGGVTTFTVEFKSASIELEVTPHVVGDSGSQAISLDVVVTRKEADFARAIDGNPPLLSRTIYTKALVKTGETVVLGGLMREDTTDTIEKVPWFSDLPFLGWMFRRTQERDDTSQLMIFLTPSILPTPLTTAGSIKTAKPQRTSRLPSAPSEVKSGQTSAPQKTDRQGAVGSGQEKQQRDQEAKSETQSDNRPQTTGLQDKTIEQSTEQQKDKGLQTTGQQTTDQQSAISSQPSALQKTDRQGAVGSEQEKGQPDQEAKSEAQSAKSQKSAIRDQMSAKTESQSDNKTTDNRTTNHGLLSPLHSDLGTPLTGDRIW
jgi:type IV pilus assembly protein PilQ